MIRNTILLCTLMLCSIIELPGSCFAQEFDSSDQSKSTKNQDSTKRKLILVVGAMGTPEYGKQFETWRAKWEAAATSAGLDVVLISKPNSESPTPLSRLKDAVKKAHSLNDDLWIVMIGHGTFDGAEAKFNLPGPDLTARELNEWLANRKAATVIINCASASGPFCDLLKGPNRVVLTSTQNGFEYNFSRFGEHLADAISDSSVDLDKDRQTSLLEAAIVANGKTADFYKSDSRLATEHAVIEDNGDGRGTPLSWFSGIRVTKKSKDNVQTDGLVANQVFLAWNTSAGSLTQAQLRNRNSLEREIEKLRVRKSSFTEDQYYAQLENLLLKLAKIYEGTEVEAASD